METIANIKSVSKEFRSGDTVVTALKDATAEFRNNELTLIIGPSGSGKTTLLSLLGCVLFPSSGQVYIKGKLVNGLNEKELARLRLENIGFVFQNFNLIAPLTSAENVMQPLRLLGMNVKEASEKATDALSKVGMQDKMKVLPKNLSGGQQQRVAIARALVTNPSLMLCDEPTAALDIRSVRIVMEELKTLATSGKSVAVVTHDFRLKAYADRIIYVHDGMVSDTPSEEEMLN